MTSLISDDDGDLVVDNLTLLGLSLDDIGGAQTRWFNVLSTQTGSSSKLSEDLPEVSITADSQKLYIVNGALLEVRDLLSGRALGDWTIPGLDERVDWKVCQGAGLLAEEHRISVFELPA
jgi:hypothetical protein